MSATGLENYFVFVADVIFFGEMAERSIVAVSKTVVRVSVPRVRIPLSPPRFYLIKLEKYSSW